MSVTILTQIQKEKAAAMFNEDGFTLTQIGTHFGVSRKTIRRVVDEINGQTREVVAPAPDLLQSDEVLVKIKEGATPYIYADSMDFDAVFVAKSDGDGNYLIQGQQIANAGGCYFEESYPFFFTAKSLEFIEQEDNAEYFFSATQDSISMVRVDGSEVETRNINKSSGQFTELRNMLVEDTSNETLKYVFTMMDAKAVIEAFSVGRVKVDADAETVVFVKPDGTERRVPEELAMDIIDTVKTYGQSRSEHLVRFLDKLMDNQSFQAIEGLYRFMKHNCIDINEDGSISAWKGVRSDLYDRHSGKIYNGNFGVEIRVDRSEVDDNVDQTCSYGLHVGAREYATSWGESLLRVRVEPQDVVAVPKDYNGQKMRCCAYTPIEVAI